MRTKLAVLLGVGLGVFCHGEMVSRWRGDNNTLDSGGSNHGVLENGATFSDGRLAQSFSLDGINDYVGLPDEASQLVRNAEGTISAWVFPAAVGDNDMIAVFGSGVDCQGKIYFSSSSPVGLWGWRSGYGKAMGN